MTAVLSTSPDIMEMTAAMIKMMTRRSLNWSRNTWRALRFSPARRAFGPNSSFRTAASREESPDLAASKRPSASSSDK